MKRIITYLIAFVLILSIIANVTLITVKNTILNKEYVACKMEENNFYENVKLNIESGFEGYIQQSGLEEEVITDLFTVDEVKQDTDILLQNIYGQEKQEIDTEKIKTRLRDKIYTSLLDVKLTSDDRKSIDDFIDVIADTYKNEIEHSDWLSKLNGKVYKVNEGLEKISIFAYALPVVLIVLLIILHIKELYKVLNKIGISLISSGILMIVATFLVRANIDIENILILNEAISTVIKSAIYQVLNNVTIASVIFEAIGIIACFVANYIKLKKKELI